MRNLQQYLYLLNFSCFKNIVFILLANIFFLLDFFRLGIYKLLALDYINQALNPEAKKTNSLINKLVY